MISAEFASIIDLTVLHADATENDIVALCRDAVEYRFASVCVNSGWVPTAARELAGESVTVCTVVGFPLGAASTAAKVAETRQAVDDGAGEIDMVMNIGQLKSGQRDKVTGDIRAVAAAAGEMAVKVILETSLLDDGEIDAACRCSMAAGAAFVKTSTGFGSGGAETRHVALMKEAAAGVCRVKASGGIRDQAAAQAMIDAGAARLGIGWSSGMAIVRGKTASSADAY